MKERGNEIVHGLTGLTGLGDRPEAGRRAALAGSSRRQDFGWHGEVMAQRGGNLTTKARGRQGNRGFAYTKASD